MIKTLVQLLWFNYYGFGANFNNWWDFPLGIVGLKWIILLVFGLMDQVIWVS